MEVLDRQFYLRDAKTVARELLGKTIVRKIGGDKLILEITETEAYLGIEDAACHSFGGRRTARTEVMYGLGGHCYIYFIYGMHYMLNAVTGREGDPCAVLIRSGNILAGHNIISKLRFGVKYEELSRSQKRSLVDGPGKICKALSITRHENGLDLTASDLIICHGQPGAFNTQVGARIGVDYAGEAALWQLNFKLRRT